MEGLDVRLLIQIGIMGATVISGYIVVRTQLARLMSDHEEFVSNYEAHKLKLDERLESAQSDRSVFQSRIDVLADINSVKALAELNTRLARLEMGQEILFKETEAIKSMHNGSHPVIKES